MSLSCQDSMVGSWVFVAWALLKLYLSYLKPLKHSITSEPPQSYYKTFRGLCQAPRCVPLRVLMRLKSFPQISIEFSTALCDKNSMAVWDLVITCGKLMSLSVWNCRRGKQLISPRFMRSGSTYVWVSEYFWGVPWHLCASVIACTLRSQGLRGFKRL